MNPVFLESTIGTSYDSIGIDLGKDKINIRGVKMRTAVYPGSFDPVTLGHINIIKRSSKMVDKLIVGVLNNSNKSPLFSVEERVNMLKEVCKDIENVEIEAFEGLLVEFLKEKNSNIIIRGLRAISDFEYELQIAQTNSSLDPTIDTIFLVTDVEYSYLSSSIVKEVAQYGGNVDQLVPRYISGLLKEKYNYKEDKNE
ncbi:phosphopantetheine adenylyltransferase [Natranaerovirga hydrolytica]|uniref:Phosphopantetheine adenylyltransferase n=2 Tax=Natranaerovirga hydrolytica TaxID=680378 RepID=A0A4R1N0D9_9FIRM|nr:phosphopantetheine adenylyltransferase [Natranaerovirga hydrolytica]